MKIKAAVVKERGVDFAIVKVEDHIFRTSSLKEIAFESYSELFPGMPLVLMTRDNRGVALFEGRPDIVLYLTDIDTRQFSWQYYDLNENVSEEKFAGNDSERINDFGIIY